MPLLDIPKSSSKVKATVELEQSTTELIDHYAQYSHATADDVIEQALQYVFKKDKEFQKHVEQQKDKPPPAIAEDHCKAGTQIQRQIVAESFCCNSRYKGTALRTG